MTAWIKEAAPSSELRRWFGHEPSKWNEFRLRYFAELDRKPEAIRPLLEAATRGKITLLYSARDTEHNSAIALAEYLSKRLTQRCPALQSVGLQSLRLKQPAQVRRTQSP